MFIWKEVLRPAVYFYEDATGAKRRLVVTKQHVHDLHQNGKDMLKDGLSIPVPKEHQPVAAMTAAQLAASTLDNNAGWVRDYRMHGGALYAKAEITDPTAEQQIKSGSVTWTSPKIDPRFVDGNGREWKNSITHLALTLRPRAIQQRPFRSLPDDFAGAAALSLTNLTEPIYPSTARALASTKLASGKSDWTLRYPVLFAMEGKMDDEEAATLDDTAAAADETAAATDETAAALDDTTSSPDPTGGGGNDTADAGLDSPGFSLPALIELLEEKDIHLPPGITTPEDFCKHLFTALHALTGPTKAAEEEAAADEAAAAADRESAANLEDPMATATPPAPVIQEQQPAFMSLTYIEKQKNPVMLSMARGLFKEGNARRLARCKALLARLPAEQRKATKEILQKKLASPAAELSLSTTGDLYDPLDETLTLLESALPDVPATLTSMTPINTSLDDAVEMGHPDASGTGISKEKRAALAESMARMANIPAK